MFIVSLFTKKNNLQFKRKSSIFCCAQEGIL